MERTELASQADPLGRPPVVLRAVRWLPPIGAACAAVGFLFWGLVGVGVLDRGPFSAWILYGLLWVLLAIPVVAAGAVARLWRPLGRTGGLALAAAGTLLLFLTGVGVLVADRNWSRVTGWGLPALHLLAGFSVWWAGRGLRTRAAREWYR